MWRAIKTGEGKYVLSVINVGKTAATLDITLAAATNGIVCKDLLTGKTRSSNPELQPNEVFYVKITDANYANVTEPVKPIEFAKLYPTLVDNTLNIYLSDWETVEMKIYSMDGSLVKSEKYTEVKNISTSVNALAAGMYLVKLTSEEQSQTLSFVKK